MLECDKIIRLYHNVITREYNKEKINNYKEVRDKYFLLEKKKKI